MFRNFSPEAHPEVDYNKEQSLQELVMPYLIDGHNLIGQLPDIDLSDPHDEAKLVLKLRSFAARKGKKITVVFDKGVPAGFDRNLSNGKVTVRFASEKSNADNVLRSIIRKKRDAPGWTIVSSDREVTQLAKQRGMRVITSHQFVHELSRSFKEDVPPTEAMKSNPHLSQDEIREWLTIFGGSED